MQRLSLKFSTRNWMLRLDIALVLSHMVHALNNAQLISCRAIYAPEHVYARFFPLIPPHQPSLTPCEPPICLDSSMRRMWMPNQTVENAKVWSCSPCILHNYFAAVDHVWAPLARVYLALGTAWHGDLDWSVQVPGLECCCRCSCSCFV
jgi:hypothetical protein